MAEGPLFDPTDPTWADRSVEVYRTMRDEHPLYVDPDGAFVALSRHADVRAAAGDPSSFSNVGKQQSPHAKPTLNSLDPPRHTKMRALLSRAFTPRRVAELEPSIRGTARQLLAGFVETGRGDALADFATVLPSVVMGRLIGLTDELIVETRHLTEEFMQQTTPHGADGPAVRSYRIFAEVLEERRRSPQDDLLSALLAAEVDGERLTEDELLAFGWLLLVGGNDTTTNLIGNGLELFARHPDVRQRLASDPAALPGAAEEVLRIASPTHTSPRIATGDIGIAGGVVPAGSRVLLVWAAANHDEREFDDPERFDIDRPAGRQLALGHGTHFCMGASLTKLEARIAWEEWLAVVPDFELAEAPRHITSPIFYGWESLPVVFPPAVALT
jgi:cytochrome P450 family 130